MVGELRVFGIWILKDSKQIKIESELQLSFKELWVKESLHSSCGFSREDACTYIRARLKS